MPESRTAQDSRLSKTRQSCTEHTRERHTAICCHTLHQEALFLRLTALLAKLTRLHSSVLPFLREQVRFSKVQSFSELRRRPCRPYHWTPLSWKKMSTPETKPGFLSAGITALSPWGSRSATPKPPPPSSHHGDDDKAAGPGAGAQRGGDHVVNRRPRLTLRKYPSDCPPLVVRWFHAVDVCVLSHT
jgi:hypothetical protein